MMGTGPEKLLTRLSGAVHALPRHPRISVAFSGGPDSSVLLEAMVRLRQTVGSGLPVLQALHVNHGLHAQAHAWADHCAEYCHARGVALKILKISIPQRTSVSPEDAAREARYQALGACLEQNETLCTAQHANDQAETLLLQLLRGAGPRGLAAMPFLRPFHSGYLARPLLTVSQEVITDCVQQWNLRVVVDPSNQDLRFARNRVRRLLRDNVLEQFPGAVKSINRSASLMAAASQAIDVLAERDIRHCRGSIASTLSVQALRQLPKAQCLEVLRFWLREQDLEIPNQARLLEVARQVITAGVDRQPAICWPGVELHRYQDRVYAFRPVADPSPTANFKQRWCLEQELTLPWGRLWSESAIGRGLKLDYAELEVRFRQGGERCQLVGHSHHRSLKHLLQEHRIPPWKRGCLPLMHSVGGIAAVAGLWVCEGYQAQSGQPGRVIHWLPADGTVRMD